MAVTRLSLTDFRNHADALIQPGPGFVVLTGENGAGKTNILEAVSLLSPGRGLRGAALRSMARSEGSGHFALSARMEDDVDLGVGTLSASPDRRIVRVNGATASASALSEWLSVLWVTPAMDRLFTDTAGARRRFLDRLVLAIEPGHAGHSARYDAAMRQRNRLLAGDAPLDDQWMTALEMQMAQHGEAIAEARTRVMVALAERIVQTPPGPFARAAIALEGETRADLAQALRLGRARDAAAGRTLTGPHRTDLQVTHIDKGQPAALCSTGEQKALLLGIVLAHAALVGERTGKRPVLLLDEVAAHLDPRRRAALFGLLDEAGGQVWVTGTEPALFAGLPASTSWHAIASGAA